MNALTSFAFLLSVGLAHSGPLVIHDNVLVITEQFFPDSLAVYTGQHDIVKIFTPINNLNFDDSEDNEEENLFVFFVEGDRDSEGNIDYKGLYVLKNDQPSKLLDNGKDFAASSDDNKQVFFAAANGIYIFNSEKNNAEKYGTITDDIVGIAKVNNTDILYILTSSNEVYKVTEEGTVKEKVDKIKNAKQIVLDSENNLHYVDTDNHVYVYSEDEDVRVVTKIVGLPAKPSYVQLLRPPFILEESIPVVVGKKGFIVYSNGTSEYKHMIFNIHPTAYSMEPTLIQFYAYNKKIYLYNILEMVMQSAVEEIQTYFSDKVEQIQSIAKQSRQTFHA